MSATLIFDGFLVFTVIASCIVCAWQQQAGRSRTPELLNEAQLKSDNVPACLFSLCLFFVLIGAFNHQLYFQDISHSRLQIDLAAAEKGITLFGKITNAPKCDNKKCDLEMLIISGSHGGIEHAYNELALVHVDREIFHRTRNIPKDFLKVCGISDLIGEEQIAPSTESGSKSPDKRKVNSSLLNALEYDRANEYLKDGMYLEIDAHLSKKPTIDKAYFLQKKRIVNEIRTKKSGILRVEPRSIYEKLIGDIRGRIIRANLAHLDPDQAGIALGILLGDTSYLSTGTQYQFRASGLSHIMAVSGQNVAIIAVALLLILKFFRSRIGCAYWFVIVFVVLYCGLTLAKPSIVRASLMFIVLTIFYLFNRDINVRKAFYLVLLIMLMADPFNVFNLGTLLSFAATGGLIFIYSALTGGSNKEVTSSKTVIALAVTISAQIATFPITGYFFGELSTYAALANLFAALPVAVILLAEVILAPSIFLPDIVTEFCWKIADPLITVGAEALLLVIREVSYLPFSLLSFYDSRVLIVVGSLIGAVLVTCLILRSGRNILKSAVAAYLGLMLMIISGSFIHDLLDTKAHIRVFDVGEGDSTLIRTGTGRTILIDGGPDSDDVLKHLVKMNIGRIDLIVLTHPHLDHISGLIGVMKVLPVDTVMEASYSFKGREYKEFLDLIEQKRITRIKAERGMVVSFGNEQLRVINPPDPWLSGTSNDFLNNNIAVIYEKKNFKMLFAGDIFQEGADRAASELEIGEVPVVLVPHHGSKYSHSRELYEEIKPDVFIISVGTNYYGHPTKEVLSYIKKAKGRLYRTDQKGSVSLITDGNILTINTDTKKELNRKLRTKNDRKTSIRNYRDLKGS